MSEKSTRYIAQGIKIGIFILPLLSLMVANFLFFPFITGKNFFFRIVVEILFFFWVFIAVFDKKYRPQKSKILLCLFLLLAILILATIFGESPYRSFWSNYERMEGLVGHLHLFAYFLILTSVFRAKKDWKIFFAIMLGVSVIASFYGLLQFFGKAAIHQGGDRVDASLGNATYLAIFLVFHIFLLGLFISWYKNKWPRGILLALILFESFIIFLTATRGAILGFLGGLFLLCFLMAFLSKNKKLRLTAWLGIASLALLVVLFLFFKNQPFIKNNYTLSRFSSFSFSEGTIDSRLSIWKMSLKGFQDHPVLGWGPENYNLVFSKYYDPGMWGQEPWFDRSHNIIFDWLISTGLLGFSVYVAVFISALFMLWRGYKRKYFSLFEAAGVSSLLAAYSFHNLFVFDNLTSYFMFFSILGFAHCQWLAGAESEKPKPQKSQEKNFYKKELSGAGYLIITFAFLLSVFSLYFVTFKPIKACYTLLSALKHMGTVAEIDVVLEKFNDVFALNTFGNGEAREQLNGYANNLISVRDIPEENKKEIVEKAAEEMQKQSNSNPQDIRYLMMLSAAYNNAGLVAPALDTINKAIFLSPNKQQLYFVKADIELKTGQEEKAMHTIKIAYDLDQTYADAGRNLAILYIANGQIKEGEEVLINHYSTPVIADGRLAAAYYAVDRYDRVRDIWLKFIGQEPNNVQYRFNLAATYLKMNQKENAIKELQKASEINPQIAEQAEYYINEIKKGTQF